MWNANVSEADKVPSGVKVYVPVDTPGFSRVREPFHSPVPLERYAGGPIVVVEDETHEVDADRNRIIRKYQGYGPHYLDSVPEDLRARYISVYRNAITTGREEVPGGSDDVNDPRSVLQSSVEDALIERRRRENITIGAQRASAVRVRASIPAVERISQKWLNTATARRINSGEEVGGLMTSKIKLVDFSQGRSFHNHEGVVTGFISAKRDADGRVKITSDERSLRCDCRDYSRKYRCEHIRRLRDGVLATAIEEYVGATENSNRVPVRLLQAFSNVTAVRG